MVSSIFLAIRTTTRLRDYQIPDYIRCVTADFSGSRKMSNALLGAIQAMQNDAGVVEYLRIVRCLFQAERNCVIGLLILSLIRMLERLFVMVGLCWHTIHSFENWFIIGPS